MKNKQIKKKLNSFLIIIAVSACCAIVGFIFNTIYKVTADSTGDLLQSQSPNNTTVSNITPTGNPTQTPNPTPAPTASSTMLVTSSHAVDLTKLEGLSIDKQGWSYGYGSYKSNSTDGVVVDTAQNKLTIQFPSGKKWFYTIPDSASLLLNKFGGLARKNENQKVVYLTFDCGSNGSPENAAKIMDTLKKYDLKATFFVPGFFAQFHPEVVKRMYDEGHMIGNHTNTHRVMPTLDVPAFMSELEEVEKYVSNAIGVPYKMNYYRAPEGNFSERDLCILNQMNYTPVFWSFAYDDWDINNQGRTAYALNRATLSLHQGEIFLLHCVNDNAAILDDLIKFVQSKGYEIKRIDM